MNEYFYNGEIQYVVTKVPNEIINKYVCLNDCDYTDILTVNGRYYPAYFQVSVMPGKALTGFKYEEIVKYNYNFILFGINKDLFGGIDRFNPITEPKESYDNELYIIEIKFFYCRKFNYDAFRFDKMIKDVATELLPYRYPGCYNSIGELTVSDTGEVIKFFWSEEEEQERLNKIFVDRLRVCNEYPKCNSLSFENPCNEEQWNKCLRAYRVGKGEFKSPQW